MFYLERKVKWFNLWFRKLFWKPTSEQLDMVDQIGSPCRSLREMIIVGDGC